MYVGPRGEDDKYQLVTEASSGGEGVLYAGTVRVGAADVPVAIKMLDMSRSVEAHVPQWMTQAEILRSLNHPNIVRVREAFEGARPHGLGQRPSGGCLYLVMEWVDGVNLDEWVLGNPNRTFHDCVRILRAVAGAIDHMHSGVDTNGVPVVHRDLKPANVVISGARVVIVDFGFARTTGGGRSNPVGTLGYIAPETYLRGEYSAASDLFSLGGIAYYLMTAEHPPLDAASRRVRARLRAAPLLSGNSAVANHLAAALSPRPEGRPPAGGARAWAGGIASSGGSALYIRPARRARTVAGVLAAAAVAAIGGTTLATVTTTRAARERPTNSPFVSSPPQVQPTPSANSPTPTPAPTEFASSPVPSTPSLVTPVITWPTDSSSSQPGIYVGVGALLWPEPEWLSCADGWCIGGVGGNSIGVWKANGAGADYKGSFDGTGDPLDRLRRAGARLGFRETTVRRLLKLDRADDIGI